VDTITGRLTGAWLPLLRQVAQARKTLRPLQQVSNFRNENNSDSRLIRGLASLRSLRSVLADSKNHLYAPAEPVKRLALASLIEDKSVT
jgi:hypothetical protein